MNRWLGRLGAALALAAIGGFTLWILMALLLLLSNYLPVWVMWALAGAIFVVTVVVDWAIDAYREHQIRNRYEIARRAALGRDDDEL